MKNCQSQQNQKMLNSNKRTTRDYVVLYLDGVLRGLISFLVVGIGLFLLLVGILKMKFIFVLPIIFIVSVLLSPFLSKITLGEKVLTGYENWLKRTFNLK